MGPQGYARCCVRLLRSLAARIPVDSHEVVGQEACSRGQHERPTFLGETERTIPRSRPAFRIAGSAGRVKGAKRDRSHAQRSEHGEDPPFDVPEHPATIVRGRVDFVPQPFLNPIDPRSEPNRRHGGVSHALPFQTHIRSPSALGRTKIPLACGKDPGGRDHSTWRHGSHIHSRFVHLGLPGISTRQLRSVVRPSGRLPRLRRRRSRISTARPAVYVRGLRWPLCGAHRF